MSVSSSHVMGGACAPVAPRTTTHDMDGLCRWRHSARFSDAVPDLRLRDSGELEVADDAGLVDEERARKAEHAVAARRRTVAVEDRLQAIEPERVQEGPRLVARLHEIDLEHDHVGLARGDPLERGPLLAAGRAPGGPEVQDYDLAAVRRKPKRLAVGARPLEVRGGRPDPTGGAVGVELRADDARVGDRRGLVQEGPEERGE